MPSGALQWMGRKRKDRRVLARCFVAKAVLSLPTTEVADARAGPGEANGEALRQTADRSPNAGVSLPDMRDAVHCLAEGTSAAAGRYSTA